jgi:hypothetical protein
MLAKELTDFPVDERGFSGVEIAGIVEKIAEER